MSRDLDRLHDEAAPDPEADEIAAAQHERATFEDLLDQRARAGTEAVRNLRTLDPDQPVNAGAHRAYRVAGDLGGAADGTGIGVPMTDGPPAERTDILGARPEDLMRHGSGSPKHKVNRFGQSVPAGGGGGGGGNRRKKPSRGVVGRPWIDDEPRTERIEARVSKSTEAALSQAGISVGNLLREVALAIIEGRTYVAIDGAAASSAAMPDQQKQSGDEPGKGAA